MLEIIGGIVISLIMILLSGIKVVKEYNQLVIFRFGKAIDSKGPGVHLVLPLIDQVETVDTRIVTIKTPVLEELTVDHIALKVAVVCLFQIVDPKRTINKIGDVNKAMEELTHASLRTIISQHTMRHLISDRGRLNGLLKSRIEKQTKDWGIKIVTAELTELKVPTQMKKALMRAKLMQEKQV